MILAIETATPVCSVALGLDSGRVVEKRIEGRGVHSERTFTFIEELLDRHGLSVDDLNAVLFSNGPGSYTGLRIGAAAIKGLLFRRDIPLYTLCTLTSYAVPFLDRAPVMIHSVIDARREHLYHRKSEIMSVGKVDRSVADIKKMEKSVQSGEIDQSDTEINNPEKADQFGETIQSDTEIKKQLKGFQTVKIIQSDPEVTEIKKLEKEIQPGEIVAGTGWERISHSEREKIEWSGSERISATNLIYAWNNDLLKPLFKKQDVDQFEPDYLTMSQINNSSI